MQWNIIQKLKLLKSANICQHGQISKIKGYLPTSRQWLPLEEECGKWDEIGASVVALYAF